MMYVPATSATNCGDTVRTLNKTAWLPAGMLTKVHKYVIGSPSTSDDLLPSSVTVAPTVTVWLGPALATGGEFTVLTWMVALSLPELFVTVNWMAYVPCTSTTNVAIGVFALDST